MIADRASTVQRGMYLAAQLDPDSAEYTVSSVTRIRGDLDAGALRAALSEVVARHDILRTGFAERDGTVVAQLHENGQVPFEVVELPFEQARHALEVAAHQPFDLGKPPLVRALLIRTAPDDHLLQIDLHHAVCDGWSVRLILDEMALEYRGGLPPQSRPYRAEDEIDDDDLTYWREQLRGVRPVDLPTPQAKQPSDARSLRFDLDAGLLDVADALARQAHTTRFVVLLAAFQAMLARWCGIEDVTVGTTVSQRDTAQLEQVIGPLFTTVVLRGDLSGDPAFSELLRRTTARVFEGMDHWRVPFEVVLEHTRTEAASDARNPLFNVLFELDHEQEQHLVLSGVDCAPFPIDYFTSKADLGLSFSGRTGTLTYRAGCVDAADIAQRYLAVLRAVTTNPASRLSELSVLTADEAAATRRFADGGTAELPDLCVHQLFEEQARRTPDAIAVRELHGTGDVTLSYAELDAAADGIACALVARGVRPETRSLRHTIEESAAAHADWLEQRFGLVPMTLLSWARIVGDVWLVGTHPQWSTSMGADPLVIEVEGSRCSGEPSIREYFDDEWTKWLDRRTEDPDTAGLFVLPLAPDRAPQGQHQRRRALRDRRSRRLR